MESSKPKVVITGVTGFLGSHVCMQFLQSGQYSVRGTVRNASNPDKIKPIQEAFQDKFSELELVEADLLRPESLLQAVEGCQYVVHTASPFPLKNVKNEDLIIKPAVEGTLAVLRACQQFKVKRVVITSSVIAILNAEKKDGGAFTEEDWSSSTTGSAYDKSKTLAERAAWEFVKNLPEQDRFELVTINPSLILGPNMIPGDFSSGQVIAKILSGKFPGMPVIQLPIVDVRDVARMHLLAIQVPEAANQRIISNCKSLWFKDVAVILNERYGQDYKIKTGELKYCTAKLASFFDPSVKLIIPIWGKEIIVENEKSKRLLGMEYTDVAQSIVEMVECLRKFGQVPQSKRKKKKGEEVKL